MGKLKNIPYFERPYEKLLMYGENSLSNSELLSIIIKTGTKQKSALEIAQILINLNENSLKFLQTISIKELKKVEGIRNIKALELKAIGEIAKRINTPLKNNQVKSQYDIAQLFMAELRNEKNEILKIVLLNHQNIIKKILTLAVGNENNISINIKSILSEPVKMQIPKIILVHNHPSGNPMPSNIDIEFTKKVKSAGQLLDIQLLDHIIIGDGTYESILDFKNERYFK